MCSSPSTEPDSSVEKSLASALSPHESLTVAACETTQTAKSKSNTPIKLFEFFLGKMKRKEGSGGGGSGGGGGGVQFQRKIPNFLKALGVQSDGKINDESVPSIVLNMADREDAEDEAPMIVEVVEEKKNDKKRSKKEKAVEKSKVEPKKKSKVKLSFKDDDL